MKNNNFLNKILDKIKIVYLVKLTDDDFIFNKEKEEIKRVEFDSYSAGKVIKYKNKYYFIDILSKKPGIYHYFDTINDLQENVGKNYVDEDKIVAVKQEPMNKILPTPSLSKRKVRKRLKETGLFFNFMK